MASVASAGEAIEHANDAALEACPAPGDPTRGLCIDRVEQVAVAAGATRDALVPIVHAYRDAVLLARDAEETPSLIDALVVAGIRVARELEVMRDAIEALIALGTGGAL